MIHSTSFCLVQKNYSVEASYKWFVEYSICIIHLDKGYKEIKSADDIKLGRIANTAEDSRSILEGVGR